MTPPPQGAETPTNEAVKAAFAYVDKPTIRNRCCLNDFGYANELPSEISARILAAREALAGKDGA